MVEEKRCNVLLTGGAGFIGSHTAVALTATGRYRAVVVDNMANACSAAVTATEKLCPPGSYEFHHIDIASEPEKLTALKFDAVIHFAALKSVGESVALPLNYYRNNIVCMVNALEAAKAVKAKVFVFSSSATVYKPSEELLTEESPLGPSNPYGQTKLVGEMMLDDLFTSDPSWRIIKLRYFNPIGAHESGTMGEDATKAANLMPAIHRALFADATLQIMGTDWPTVDGTGVRDYIHVMDLAEGHVAALDACTGWKEGRNEVYNLGSGKGVSVREMITAFQKASGRTISSVEAPRRAGDLAKVIADPAKAQRELKWLAKRSTQDACIDGWRWMSTHPQGFQTQPAGQASPKK